MPVSLTLNSMCEFTRCSSTCTRPPLGVNLMALVSRFQTTCCRRAGSPDTTTLLRVEHALQAHALGVARPAAIESSAPRTIVEPARPAARPAAACPAMMRLRSSRSSISCTCARALRSITSMRGCTSVGVGRAARAQQLRPAEDRVERRAQLVRERGEELVLDARRCAAPACARCARPRASRRARRRCASSASARLRSVRSRVTLAKPTQPARVVAQRRDRDVGPEARAVLAHAPAFVDEAALCGGDLAARARASRCRTPPADRTSRSAGR